MDNIQFENDEKLYRAILPLEPFVKKDGSISSAAFKDRNGLSVDRQMHRFNHEAVEFIKNMKSGSIVSITVGICRNENILCVYCPVEDNKYHSELHKDENKKALTSAQAKHLSQLCVIEYDSQRILSNERNK